MRVLAAVLAIVGAMPALATDPADYDAIVRTMLSDVIRPRFEALATAAAAMDGAVAAVCATGGPVAMADVKSEFSALALAWADAQALRLGPARTDDLYERMSFGSDPKNYVGRQLGRLIADADVAALEPDTFAEKSIAIQGLTALELLLTTRARDETSVAFHCALTTAIASNIAGIAERMNAGWSDPDGFTRLILQPGPENPLFRDGSEAAMEVFKLLPGFLRFVIDVKLKAPLQDTVEHARPRQVEYWRTGLTNDVLIGNLATLEDVYGDGGFSARVAAADAGLDGTVRRGLATMIDGIEALGMPFDEALTDPKGRSALAGIIEVGEETWRLVAFDVAAVLDLPVGFNEFDGD